MLKFFVQLFTKKFVELWPEKPRVVLLFHYILPYPGAVVLEAGDELVVHCLYAC